jgi:monothiol glutaredoxin
MLNPEIRTRIESLIGSDRVVLFMKGTREMPQCGFSAQTVGILDALLPQYHTVNVLEDQEVREGIKAFSSWPTIPQLYIDREFVGGCDIVRQMFNTGALHQTLGAEAPDRTPPDITLSEAAAEVIRRALESQPANAVHLSIDSRWQHGFRLGPPEGHEIRSTARDVEILLDVASAGRARGLSIDVEETVQGTAFRIDNPNAPPPVREMDVHELKRRLDAGESVHLFDVREPSERERAVIDGARPLDAAAMDVIRGLPKDAPLVFHCHHGQRSLGAAEHFRMQGYRDVSNLAGGIDAWSREIDPGVARY